MNSSKFSKKELKRSAELLSVAYQSPCWKVDGVMGVIGYNFGLGPNKDFLISFPSIHPVQSEALVDIMNEVQDKILEHDRQRSITVYEL
jgi:hypothetical protein